MPVTAQAKKRYGPGALEMDKDAEVMLEQGAQAPGKNYKELYEEETHRESRGDPNTPYIEDLRWKGGNARWEAGEGLAKWWGDGGIPPYKR